MEKKTIHIQFDDNKKYIGQVNPAEQLKKGYLNIEVSADEHEDIEKNKDNADYVHNFLVKKSGIKLGEATYPLFGDSDMESVRQKIVKHGRNPDTMKHGESVHIFTHKSDGNIAQVHYDPHLDKYKVLGKSSSGKGVHLKFFNKVENAHAHAKEWVKNPVNESMDFDIQIDEQSIGTESHQSLVEISKEKLKDYIRANVEDRLLRTSGASFKSGKAGDEFNKADETETDEKRKKGLDKAMDKLTKENLDESILDKNKTYYGVFARDSEGNYSHDSTHKLRSDAQDAVDSHESKGAFHIPLSHDEAKSLNNGDKESINNLMKQKRKSGIRGTFKMNESFGAKILSSIINNKPIDAQEQFGHALGEIIRSKMDTLRQEVGSRIFNKVNESDNYHDTYRSALDKAYSTAKSRGYDLHDHELETGYVDPAPYEGETKSLHFTLSKNGKEQKEKMHVQVYKRDASKGKSYELNHYIS